MVRDRDRALHGPETGYVTRHIVRGRNCDADRDRRPPRRGRGALRFGTRNAVPIQTASRKDDEGDADRDDAATVRSCTAWIVRHGAFPPACLPCGIVIFL